MTFNTELLNRALKEMKAKGFRTKHLTAAQVAVFLKHSR